MNEPKHLWPAVLTKITGERVRYHRDNHPEGKMSAQRLADSLTDLGIKYTRAQVTNLEAGRRDTVTIGEILALASVLEVPPLLLVVPVGTDTDVEILPGRTTDPWSAARWITGEEPPPGAQASETWRRSAELLELFTSHAQLIIGWRSSKRAIVGVSTEEEARLRRWADDRRESIESQILSVRRLLRLAGAVPPPLPPELGHLRFLDDDPLSEVDPVEGGSE